jgi:hypothetical protein
VFAICVCVDFVDNDVGQVTAYSAALDVWESPILDRQPIHMVGDMTAVCMRF